MPPWWHSHENPEKNRFVEIFPRSGEPLDGKDWQRFSKHFEHKHLWQRIQHVLTCELLMHKVHIWILDLFVASKWYCAGNFVASENCSSCQHANKEVKENTTAKAMSFHAQISSRSVLVGKLSLTKVLYGKERRKMMTKLDFFSC